MFQSIMKAKAIAEETPSTSATSSATASPYPFSPIEEHDHVRALINHTLFMDKMYHWKKVTGLSVALPKPRHIQSMPALNECVIDEPVLGRKHPASTSELDRMNTSTSPYMVGNTMFFATESADSAALVIEAESTYGAAVIVGSQAR